MLQLSIIIFIGFAHTAFSSRTPESDYIKHSMIGALNKSIDLIAFDTTPLNVTLEMEGVHWSNGAVFVQRMGPFLHYYSNPTFNLWLGSRVEGIMQLIQQSIWSEQVTGDFEFFLYVDDPPSYCLLRPPEGIRKTAGAFLLTINTLPSCMDVTIPDMNFLGWEAKYNLMMGLSAPKIRQVYFFGQESGSRRRYVNVSQDSKMLNVTIFQANGPKSDKQENTCGFAYVLHLEGRAYSGRLKFLMMCGSVILADFDVGYTEFWSVLLYPWKHYIPVTRTTLVPIVNDLERMPHIQQHLSNAARDFARSALAPYLIPQYWGVVLRRLSHSVALRKLSRAPLNKTRVSMRI